MIGFYAAGAKGQGGGGGSDPYIDDRNTIANFGVNFGDPFRVWTPAATLAPPPTISGGWLVLDGGASGQNYGVQTAGDSTFNFSPGGFALEAYCHLDAYPSNPSNFGAIMARWQGSGSTLSWLFGITSAGKLGLYWYDGSFHLPASAASVPLGVPFHAAAFEFGGELYVAIDGVPEMVQSSPFAPQAQTGPVMIGVQSDLLTSKFVGKLRGVRSTETGTGGYGASTFTPPSFPLPTS